MLELSRVIIPLTLNCNLKCKYCYRKAGIIESIPCFSEDMIQYLNNLKPSKCSAVVASGGEPLLVWDKVKELFSYVPFLVHKKIMTNGLELTKEIIDYCNENNIEIVISHDGDMTEYLRGYDILKDNDILYLINQLNNISFHGVCTKYNPNPYVNFLNTQSYFAKKIFYNTGIIFEDTYSPELVFGFNFTEYCKGYLQLLEKGLIKKASFDIKKQFYEGFNLLPDGSVVGMSKIHHKYGTIHNSLEELKNAKKLLGDYDECINNPSCPIKSVCNCSSQIASKSYCEGVKQITFMLKSLENKTNYDF